MKTIWLAVPILWCQGALGAGPTGAVQLPSFLPDWFSPALTAGGKPLHLVQQSTMNGREQFGYASDDQSVQVVVAHANCTAEVCRSAMNVALQNANQQLTRSSGQFDSVTATEFSGSWQEPGARTTLSVFLVPGSILYWTRRAPSGDPDAGTFGTVLPLVNRQRYEVARTIDNVEFGRWGPQINDHARQLLANGQKAEALAVFRQTLVASPNDLAAQMDFAENTDDSTAARASATAVFGIAEPGETASRAAKLLGTPEPALAEVPLLEKNGEGLQVILVPLPPCDLRLLKRAAEIYETITQVPARIRRFDTDWQFGPPDRMGGQKQAQQAIVEMRGQAVDFSGWTLERYAREIRTAVSGKDALTTYSANQFIAQVENQPGQYLVDPYLRRFIQMLGDYRSKDVRTLYVGVTGANIYSGSLNYLFSQWTQLEDQSSASILSYAMMLRGAVGSEYESRQQVAERLAKEMVPASLQSLGIPRAVDPTDPYSYSNGVERLAQKTLTLSAGTREALDKFRE